MLNTKTLYRLLFYCHRLFPIFCTAALLLLFIPTPTNPSFFLVLADDLPPITENLDLLEVSASVASMLTLGGKNWLVRAVYRTTQYVKCPEIILHCANKADFKSCDDKSYFFELSHISLEFSSSQSRIENRIISLILRLFTLNSACVNPILS